MHFLEPYSSDEGLNFWDGFLKLNPSLFVTSFKNASIIRERVSQSLKKKVSPKVQSVEDASLLMSPMYL